MADAGLSPTRCADSHDQVVVVLGRHHAHDLGVAEERARRVVDGVEEGDARPDRPGQADGIADDLHGQLRVVDRNEKMAIHEDLPGLLSLGSS
jgi:hypothetical protein